MKKILTLLVLVTVLCSTISLGHAMVVFDPSNYALNTVRNVLMESQHVRDMLEAAKRFYEMKRMAEEFRFFNSELIEKGFSEIRSLAQTIRFFTESPEAAFKWFQGQFTGGFWTTLRENPLFEGSASELHELETWVNRAESGTALSYYLNQVPDPLSPRHRYITFEQAEIIRSFEQADALRGYARGLAEEGRALAEAAAQANLLGASRLQAASMGKLYEILGVMLIAEGRLAELHSISIEQVSRQEKQNELARERVIQDLGEFVTGERLPAGEVL